MAITNLIADYTAGNWEGFGGVVFTEQTEAQFIADPANTLGDDYSGAPGFSGSCMKITIPTSVASGTSCGFRCPDFTSEDLTAQRNFFMRCYIPRDGFLGSQRTQGFSGFMQSGNPGGVTGSISRIISIQPADSQPPAGWDNGKQEYNTLYADPNNKDGTWANDNWRDDGSMADDITAVGGTLTTDTAIATDPIIFWIFDSGYVTAQAVSNVVLIFDDAIDTQSESVGGVDSLQGIINNTNVPVTMSFYAPQLDAGGVMSTADAVEMTGLPSVEQAHHGDHAVDWSAAANAGVIQAQLQENKDWGVLHDRVLLNAAAAPNNDPGQLVDGSYQEDALSSFGIEWCRYVGKRFFNYELTAGNPLLMNAWAFGVNQDISVLADWTLIKANLLAIGGNAVIYGHGTPAAGAATNEINAPDLLEIIQDMQDDPLINIIPLSTMMENMGLTPFQALSLGANGMISSFIK